MTFRTPTRRCNRSRPSLQNAARCLAPLWVSWTCGPTVGSLTSNVQRRLHICLTSCALCAAVAATLAPPSPGISCSRRTVCKFVFIIIHARAHTVCIAGKGPYDAEGGIVKYYIRRQILVQRFAFAGAREAWLWAHNDPHICGAGVVSVGMGNATKHFEVYICLSVTVSHMSQHTHGTHTHTHVRLRVGISTLSKRKTLPH